MVIVIRNSSDPSLLDLHIAAAAAQKRSSSSILMGRQQQQTPPQLPPDWGMGIGPEVFLPPPGPPPGNTDSNGPSHDSTTMDCDPKDKSHKGDGKTNDDQQPTTIQPDPDANPTTTTTTATGPAPAIARRRFRRPMRRDSVNARSIFERDGAPNTVASGNPITVSDILKSYMKPKAATRKRAPSPRTTRNFN
jgi:hypothetical protein